MLRILTWLVSLRTRLLLLVLLAVIPAFVLAFFVGQEKQQQAVEDARLNGLQHAKRASDIQVESIQAKAQLLASFALLPSMHNAGPIPCDIFTAELIYQYPFYAAIGSIDQQGNVVCQSPPRATAANLNDDPYFRHVIESSNIFIGDYGIGSALGEPAIQIAVPIFDPSGKRTGAAFAALKIDWFEGFALDSALPDNSTFVITDRQNALFLRHPPTNQAGPEFVPAKRAAQMIGTLPVQVILVTDADQVERLYAFVPVNTVPGSNGGAVGIGLPTEVVYKSANEELRRNLLLLLGVAIIVLAITWVFGDLFFLRGIRALSVATGQLSAGDLSARTRGPFVGGELSELVRRFNRMAETLQRREAERTENQAALQKWADIFKNTKVGIALTDAAATRIEALNPAYAEMHGYTIDEMQAMPLAAIYAPEARASFENQVRLVAELKHHIFESKHVRKDGTVFPTWVDATVVTDAQGAILYRITNVQDLTSMKQAEQAEREQRAFAESLRDTASVLTSSLDFDTVLDHILDNVGRVVPHSAAQIMLVESQVARVVGHRGYRERNLEDWLLALRMPVEEFPLIQSVMQTNKPRLIPDTLTCAEWIATPEIGWVRSVLLVPLSIKDKTIGILELVSDTPNFFIATHGIRLQAFADQAAIALENANLLEQTNTRADQLALLYDAGLALNSVLDPRTQIEFLLKISMRALGADRGEFFRWDSAAGRVRLDMHIDTDETHSTHMMEDGEFALGEERGIVGKAAEQRFPVNIGNLQQDPRWIPANPTLRSGLWVSILHEQTLLGVLCLFSKRPHAFTNKDERLLVLFANQVAVAMENARLFQAQGKRTIEIETLRQASLHATSTLELPQVLEQILQYTLQLMASDNAHLFLYDGEKLDFAAAKWADGIQRAPFQIRPNGISYTVAQQGERIIVSNMKTHPLFANSSWDGAIVSIPLKTDTRVCGVMNVSFQQPHEFGDDELLILDLMADQATIAIENARLFAETRHQLAETEATNRLSNVMQGATNVTDMLAALLDESLSLMHTSAGEVFLFNAFYELEELVTRSWFADLARRPLQPNQGITWHVFTTGKAYFTRDYASDPLTREAARPRIPKNWGGAAIPISAGHQVFGVLHIAVESPRVIDSHQAARLKTFAEITGNAVQRVRLRSDSELQMRRLNALHVVDTAISGSLNLRVTLDVILDQVTSQLGVDAADIFLTNGYDQTLTCAVGRGLRSAGLTRTRLRTGDGYPGRAILEPQAIHMIDLKNDQGDPRWRELAGEGLIAYAATALVAKGQAIGVLEVFHRLPLHWHSDMREFFQTLAGESAIAVASITTVEELQKSNTAVLLAYDSTLETWARLLDVRHREKPEHTLRVAEIAVQLGRCMGAQDRDLLNIRRGALLHDIGKMNIPEHILFETQALVETKQDLLRQYPQLARDYLSSIPYLRAAVDIPYCQAEWWDGSGYPQGLQGEQIPFAARLFAVVHTWVKMRDGNGQNAPCSAQATREYLLAQSGKRFDPIVTKAFLQLVDSEPKLD